MESNVPDETLAGYFRSASQYGRGIRAYLPSVDR